MAYELKGQDSGPEKSVFATDYCETVYRDDSSNEQKFREIREYALTIREWRREDFHGLAEANRRIRALEKEISILKKATKSSQTAVNPFDGLVLVVPPINPATAHQRTHRGL